MTDSNLLPVVELSHKSQAKPWKNKAWLLHIYRVGIVVLLLWLIREHHLWLRAQSLSSKSHQLSVEQVKPFFPTAARLTKFNPTHGGQYVANSKDELLGYAIQTSPQADEIIGYVGPTNVMIAVDLNSTLLGISVLESRDTFEHVEQIKNHQKFMSAFTGLKLDELDEQPSFDAVSGATLTSIAIVESVNYRLSGKRLSYKFPDALALKDIRPIFPEATQLLPVKENPGLIAIVDSNKTKLGTVMRTSPSADDLNGYQGPIETLVAFNPAGKVQGIYILNHYETPKYVSRIQKDERFMQLFDDMTLKRLSNLDVFEDEIEGTSGATMTCITMVDGMRAAAKNVLSAKQPKQRTLQISQRDIGTAIIILMAVIISCTRLRGLRLARIVFQIGVIVYLGFLNTDFVSQAIISGWTKNGVPWKMAPGLVLLVAVAVAFPLLTRKQLYCHHICPHGALQQLLHHLPICRFLFPKRVAQGLKCLPALLLLCLLLAAMLWPEFNLASVEPFDAWLIKTAGWATLTVAIIGLIVALFVPMAYCRFGCPTGALLNFLRLSGHNDKFSMRDLFALLMLSIAAGIWHWSTG